MSVVDEILTDAIFPGLPMEELPLVVSEESALFTGDVPAISEALDSGEQPSSATRSSEDLPPVLQCEGEDNSVDGEDGSGVGGSENIEDNNNLRRHGDDDDHVAALAGFNESSGESGQFLDELDDQVRESVLRTCDEKFLRTLPEKYRTEAMSLRGQVGGVVVQADGTEDDDESDDEGTFEVEKIVDCVIRDDGVKYFLVRWKRYGPSADTWEPEHNMIDCKKLVDEYMHKQQQEEQRLKKNSSKAGEQPATRTSRARANKAGREVAKPSPSKVSSPAGKQDDGRKSRRTAAVKDAAASRRRTQASGGEEDERKNDDEEEEDSDEEELTSAEGEYQIERILSWRNGAKGREYRVKWLGYPHSQNTWEPEKNIDGCDVFIEYHAKTFPNEHPSDDEDNDNDDGGGDENKTGRTRSRSRRDIHDIDIDDDDEEEVMTTAGSSRVINDEEEEEEEEESMRMMAIEKVVDERSSGNGTREYLVKWKGRASSHNSWLPEQQLTGEPALISYQDRRTPARDKRSRSEMARSPMRRPASSSSSSSTGNLLEPEASPGSSTLLELVGISEIERCRRDGPDEFSWLVKKKKNQRRGVWLQQSDLAYPLQTWVAMGYLQNYSPSATVQALGLSLSPASGRPVRSLSSAGTPVYCTASNVRPADDSDSIAYCRSCLRHGHVVPFLDLLPSPTMDSIRTHLDIDSSHWHSVAACRPVTAVLSSVSILSKMVAFLPLAPHAKTRVAAFAVDIPPGRDCYALKIDAAYFALVPIDVPVIRIVRSTGLHSQEILVRPKLGCVIFHSSPAEVLLTSPDEGITYHYLLLAFLADDSLSSSLLLSASPLKPAHAITATTVPDFLEEIGLRQYAGLFQENGFDLLDDVFALDDDALAKLGIGLMGHRTRILRFAKQATSNELA